MTNREVYLLGLLAAMILGLVLRGCVHKTPTGNVPVVSTDFPSSDTVRVAVKDNVLEVQTPDSTTYRYLPEEGQAIIDIKHEPANPVITVTNKGFTRRFGIGAFFADRARLGLDCEFFYWNRWGAFGGVGLAAAPTFAGYLGVGYQLDQIKLNNTSVWAGYTSTKDMAIGVRVAF